MTKEYIEFGCGMIVEYISVLVICNLGFLSGLVSTRSVRFISNAIIMPKMTLNDGCRAMAIVPESAASYFRSKPLYQEITWKEAFEKIAAKVSWEKLNGKYSVQENTDLSMKVSSLHDMMREEAPVTPVLILVGIQDDASEEVAAKLQKMADGAKVVTAYNCSLGIMQLQKYGDYDHTLTGWRAKLIDKYSDILKLPQRSHKKAYSIVQDMWSRRSLEDLLFMVFVLIDTFGDYPIKSVASVTNTEATSFTQMSCMVGNCREEIFECLQDEQCRKALDCLNNCRGNDQVCSYRCITSYESPAFEKFAYCILQRYNCMCNSAATPQYPSPQELLLFRGEPLDYTTAENIFVGHLQLPSSQAPNPLLVSASSSPSLHPWSWKVVCGQNPAYDYFACQHQIFYRDFGGSSQSDGLKPGNHTSSKSSFWYDPVFQVTTIDGRVVWRRRHYRVRRGKKPGQFFFSVLDNGVASNEFWKILDCADDLSWAVFHYVGAAAAAGTSYTGSLIVTPDGRWPNMTTETTQRIDAALAKGEISNWELFEVDNGCCDVTDNPPPLGIPAFGQES